MSIDDYRRQIIEITGRIIELIGERNELAKKIAEAKRLNNMPVDDFEAEERLIDSILKECNNKAVDEDTVLKILSVLMEDSKKVQREVLGSGASTKQRITPMAMASAAMELERSGKKLYRLDVGEPNFEPPPKVVEACCSAVTSFKTHYTQTRGVPELVKALSVYLKRRHGYDARLEQIVVTPGGRFAIFAALSSILKEGESVLLVEPNWPMYREAVEYLGCRPIVVHTELNTNWEPSVEQIEGKIKQHTKAIVLSYPCNPTGKIISRQKFGEIIELANKKHITILSDEIYNDYAYSDCPSILDYDADSFVLTSSFSKSWAMTGFRIGWAVSSPDIIGKMLKIASLMITSVPEFVQYAAIAALESEDVVKRNSERMKTRIDLAVDQLRKIRSLEFMKPDGGMYVFPKVRDGIKDASELAMKLLRERGVSITPGEAFGDYPDHFRISLGQSEDVITEGIRRIGELLR
ncbi:MAG: aminotransferase class I/II-fold pyridoxal phosphate-dependent enzyme [Conexivisphaerales archaeon]